MPLDHVLEDLAGSVAATTLRSLWGPGAPRPDDFLQRLTVAHSDPPTAALLWIKDNGTLAAKDALAHRWLPR